MSGNGASYARRSSTRKSGRHDVKGVDMDDPCDEWRCIFVDTEFGYFAVTIPEIPNDLD